MRRIALSFLLAPLLVLTSASAQIVVGQTAGFTGAAAAGSKEITDGAKLYLDAVNARGGVNGQTIELRSLDDKFDPKLAAANAKRLLADPQLVALFLTRGTPHTMAILPLLAETKTPLIGPSTGAIALHRPVNPWVFNVRATYQREAERAVTHLCSVGLARIAVVHVDDPFGEDGAAGARRGFELNKFKPVLTMKYDRAKPDFVPLAKAVAAADAQAVLFIGTGQSVADGVAAIRAAGNLGQIVTLSNNASGGFVKQLGAHSRGTIVSQVFPSERSLAVPIIKEANDLAKAKGVAALSPAMLEGYAAAKVLVEGLRRAGRNPTRENLTAALNGLSRFDIGGMEVSFSPTDHTGLDYSDLSIVGADGRFMR
jgi:ABC-type branched-subunit amino acid transport system substrate-binding protein